MAEFSVIIKKKDSDDNRKVMFLDSTDYSSDDTAQLSTTKKTKKNKKSPRKRLLEKRQQTFPVCPVCRDLLDERIKRIYTKPISTEVYFPFLDHVPSIPSSRSARVKICYPCYEHLMRQWKEFNRAGIPQRKRKYRDRNGDKIKSEKELQQEEQQKLEDGAAQENKDKEFAGISGGEENQTKESDEAAPKKELTKEEELEIMLSQLHMHIQLIEFNTNSYMEQKNKEVEQTIRKYSNRMRDEIQSLKIEIVRKQVVRMRREIGELRLELTKDVHDVKKKVTKQEKLQSDNESNLKKNAQPFLP
ncbi:uncharacterized protein LOC130623361 [Hydractinia symbiolongicarpus]|uniref:uncharacterized protein LOC130623361 n=1 Tax=Hydractinia symbiolongicarpus TaxID=13093 RepID=UPI00254ADE9A|nr:uncharacterized protein LOC130623361 [Hydractinia symbiolongicarpus]